MGTSPPVRLHGVVLSKAQGQLYIYLTFANYLPGTDMFCRVTGFLQINLIF